MLQLGTFFPKNYTVFSPPPTGKYEVYLQFVLFTDGSASGLREVKLSSTDEATARRSMAEQAEAGFAALVDPSGKVLESRGSIIYKALSRRRWIAPAVATIAVALAGVGAVFSARKHRKT